MENKCTCLHPQVNCFNGQCSYCNKPIEKQITVEDLNRKNTACECGNETFTHRHSNWIEWKKSQFTNFS